MPMVHVKRGILEQDMTVSVYRELNSSRYARNTECSSLVSRLQAETGNESSEGPIVAWDVSAVGQFRSSNVRLPAAQQSQLLAHHRQQGRAQDTELWRNFR